MNILHEYRDRRRALQLPGDWKFWVDTVLLSFFLYAVIALYVDGVHGLLVMRSVNKSIGYVSFVLVLLSMAMSSICYFWDFADRFMAYRKYLGIVGFVYAGLHFYLSLLLIYQNVGFGAFFANNANWFPFITALTSFCILLFMTLISHAYAIKHLGGKLWKMLLRLGYLAIVFAILHIGAREYMDWFDWITGTSLSLVPPMSLVLFALTCVILSWRAMMEYDLRSKKGSATVKK